MYEKNLFCHCLYFFLFFSFSQQKWENRPAIKTNIFNLIMRRPSIALDIPVTEKISIMPSAAFGKFNWGDFGGLRKYKSYEAEVKRHCDNTYYGGYIKHTTKTVYSEKGIIAGYIPISKDRNFKGQGLAVGASNWY